MNADPFRPLPTRSDYEADKAKIEEQEALIQRILHQVQHFESEEREREWNPIAIVVLAYAAALCVVIGWIAAERMF